jgi:hypothetical protein
MAAITVPLRTTLEPRITRRQALRAAVASAGLSCLSNVAPAATAQVGCRPGDEIWLVSTRHLSCPSACAPRTNWDIQQCVAGRWRRRSADEFFGTVNNVERTLFFVHGNRTEAEEVVPDGHAVHSALLGSPADIPPVRFVLWSWPADQLHRPIKDVRIKAVRADAERYYLAPFLARFPGNYPLGLVGYSFGARVVSSALHLIGANSTPAALAAGPQFHAALWAAAYENDWLLAGQPYQCAGVACSDWFITANPCDRALKWFHVISKGKNADALGYAGLASGPVPGAPLIMQMNVGSMIGDSHSVYRYLMFEEIQEATRQVVLRQGKPA